jgi:thiosulfate dehydrogenase [quinone] large subunit
MSASTRANIGLFLARLPLGALFLCAGYMKIAKMGVGNFVFSASKNIPAWLPHELGSIYLHALPFAEFLVGLFVIVGFFTRTSGLIMSLILISNLIAMGAKTDQGPFSTNFIYLGLSLMLMLMGGGDASVDRIIARKKSKSASPA